VPRFKLTIEYEGSAFSGWQRQENGASVQGALEQAVFRLTGAESHVQGAGRTDAGVHASGQVAHVDLERAWDGFKLREALNAHLVAMPVCVLAAEPAPADFDARRSAIHRRYLYLILNRRAPLTLQKGRAWRVKRPLDAEAMRSAARALIGRHDFTTFRDSQCQAASPMRTLDVFEVERTGDEIRCWVGARSFLHRQVRSMVGSLVEVGLGKWSAADLRAALEAADRSRCGQVAPPDGLYLTRVDYPKIADDA
jgi:tRNA pseudouridine38-40 synthase